MLKKLGFIFYTLSALGLLIENVLAAISLNLGLIFDFVCIIGFWVGLVLGATLTIVQSLKRGSDSGYFKKTKVIDIILLSSALLYFISTFIKVDLLVAIFFPLIVYFFELHLLFNTKD